MSVLDRITDHAVLRYLEASHGIDMEMIRREIFDESLLVRMDAKAKKYERDGLTFIIKGGNVVTVFGGERRIPQHKTNKPAKRSFKHRRGRRG